MLLTLSREGAPPRRHGLASPGLLGSKDPLGVEHLPPGARELPRNFPHSPLPPGPGTPSAWPSCPPGFRGPGGQRLTSSRRSRGCPFGGGVRSIDPGAPFPAAPSWGQQTRWCPRTWQRRPGRCRPWEVGALQPDRALCAGEAIAGEGHVSLSRVSGPASALSARPPAPREPGAVTVQAPRMVRWRRHTEATPDRQESVT